MSTSLPIPPGARPRSDGQTMAQEKEQRPVTTWRGCRVAPAPQEESQGMGSRLLSPPPPAVSLLQRPGRAAGEAEGGGQWVAL